MSAKKLFFYILNFIIVGFIGVSLVYHPSLNGAVTVSNKMYILCAAVTVVISVFLGFLEKKICYFERFFSFVFKKRFVFCKFLVFAAVSAVFAVVLELILGRFVFGVSSNGAYFNVYRFYFFWGAAYLVTYIIYHAVKHSLKAENAFLTVALVSGIVMIFASPFGHTCWDVESHYTFALKEASINGVYTEAIASVRNISDDYMPKASAKENEKNIKTLNELDKIYAGNLGNGISLPHLPAAIALGTGRLFGLSFYMKECLAKLVNLIFYSLLCFFAIKKLKNGKMIFFVLGLVPTNIFVAANITYDWWVNGFMMLGIAYFIAEYEQPLKKITTLETVVMCGSLALACLPKQVYFPVLLLPFLLKKQEFGIRKNQKKKHIAVCVFAAIFLLLSFALRSVSEISVGGDARGGADVNAGKQISFILSNPFKYTGILLKFLWDYLSVDNMVHAFCDFSLLGIFAGYTLVVIMLIAAVLTDKADIDNEYLCAKNRIFVALICVAEMALVPTALYVAFTPVANKTVLGCQPRYMMPVLITGLPFLSGKKFVNKMDRSSYTALFAVGCAVCLFIGIYEAMILRMV